jgi:ankyrin repeat protein
MFKLPLPPRPNLDYYKKRAKELVAVVANNAGAGIPAWAREYIETLAGLLGMSITPHYQQTFDQVLAALEQQIRQQAASAHDGHFKIADAQHFLARLHGFGSWADLSKELTRLTRLDPETQRFETAVDSVISGNLGTLTSLLDAHPNLVHERSRRKHRATLLHYVAANGVEDYRQKTPPNIVEVARLLLTRGAEVDALASTYGDDSYQTTMNLLVSSAHPAIAGLQAALAELLLDFGAAINGLDDDASPLMTALFFGYLATAQTLAQRGCRVDNIVAAASLGRLDLVKNWVVNKEKLKPGVPFITVRWYKVPRSAKAHTELALAWACRFQHAGIADYLLDMGVHAAAADPYKMTALHWAAANGMMDLIERLVKLRAPLEVENQWGGTVLNSTLHFALFQPTAGVDYPAVIETLLEAGADVSIAGPYPSGNEQIDEVLRRHGNRKGIRNHFS